MRKIAFILFLILGNGGVKSQTPPSSNPPKQIVIPLTQPYWELVLKGLAELPLKEAAPLYSYINQQIAIQTQPIDTIKKQIPSKEKPKQ